MKKLMILLGLFPIISEAQKNYPALLDQYVQGQASFNDFSGTVLVTQKDRVVYKKAFGMADREWNIPNTLETKFLIGSLTKQFTAAAILQLVEKGKLNLNDVLSKFFPDFPKGDSVTIHMLLNHSSGIKGYTDLPRFSSVEPLPFPQDSVIAFFKHEPYDFSPGTKYKYSNSGYFLLGCIVEKASGMSYEKYINENLIKKAGLKNTGMNRADSILANRAHSYIKTPQGWRNARYISMEFPFSAGAIFSTAEDLLQWKNALYGGKIIPAEMLTKMTTPYPGQYGYGLHIDSLGNHKHIGHAGSIQAFVASIEWYPAEEVCIIVLANNRIASANIGEGLAALLFDMPLQMPYDHKEAKIDASQFANYMGKYLTADNQYIELFTKDNKVYRKMENGRAFELKAESGSRLYYQDLDAYIDFKADEKGGVKATLTTYGLAGNMRKIN